MHNQNDADLIRFVVRHTTKAPDMPAPSRDLSPPHPLTGGRRARRFLSSGYHREARRAERVVDADPNRGRLDLEQVERPGGLAGQ